MRGDGRQKKREPTSAWLLILPFSSLFSRLHSFTTDHRTYFFSSLNDELSYRLLIFFSKTEALALWLVSRSRIAWLYLDDGRRLGGRETQPGNLIGRREKNKRPSVPPSRANELLNGVASYAKLLLSGKHSVSLSVSTLVGVPREWTLD